jgi:putative transport protein
MICAANGGSVHWLNAILAGDSMAGLVVAIAVASAAGVAIGHKKFRGLSLGISMVMFTGILYAHCFWRDTSVASYAQAEIARVTATRQLEHQAAPAAAASAGDATAGAPDPTVADAAAVAAAQAEAVQAQVQTKIEQIRHRRHEILEFVRDFGLILFVFAVGMSVGPGFLSSLRSEGIKWNMLAAMNVLMAVGMAILAMKLLNLGVPGAVGALSGAVTNTPGLSAAQQALHDALHDPAMVGLAATAFAVAYPFGMFGKMSTLILFRYLLRIDFKVEAERFARASGRTAAPENADLEVANPGIDGKCIHEILARVGDKAVISRIKRDGTIRLADHDEALRIGDVVHAVGTADCLRDLEMMFGRRSSDDLRAPASQLVIRRVIVTSQRVVGQEVGKLDLLRAYGVNITRVNRAGIEFAAVNELKLNFADSVTVVGPEDSVVAVSNLMGNATKRLEHPQLVPMFVAILLGVLIGCIPLPSGFPAPVKFGLAGGPIVVALVLSAMGRFGRMNFYMPASANLLLKEFGIVLFLVAVGLVAGEEFVAKAFSQTGFIWACAALAIVMVPLCITVLVARFVAKMDYLAIMGLCTGSTTDPPSMAFACSLAGNESPAVTFATVYPLTMLLRIITAQVFVLFWLT